MNKCTFFFAIGILIILGNSCRQKNSEFSSRKLDNIGFLPSGSQYQILIDSGELVINKNHLFLDAGGNLYLSVDSIIFPLLPDEANTPFFFPDANIPDQICCFIDGTVFYTEDSLLKKAVKENTSVIMLLPFEQIQISKAGENGVYLFGVNQEDKLHYLFFIDKNNNTITKLLSDSLPIEEAIGTGHISMVAIQNIVYLLKNKEMQAIFEAESDITSLADNGIGFFYATKRNVGYFDDKGYSFSFLEQGAIKLLPYGETLYILDEVGKLSRINGIDKFADFRLTLDSLKNR